MCKQHIFTCIGGTRFIATMACGAASIYLVIHGHLTGDQYVELGVWTIGVFVAGNASQNVASFLANRRNNKPEYSESKNDNHRQY